MHITHGMSTLWFHRWSFMASICIQRRFCFPNNGLQWMLLLLLRFAAIVCSCLVMSILTCFGMTGSNAASLSASSSSSSSLWVWAGGDLQGSTSTFTAANTTASCCTSCLLWKLLLMNVNQSSFLFSFLVLLLVNG